jgi:hypothetical protein
MPGLSQCRHRTLALVHESGRIKLPRRRHLTDFGYEASAFQRFQRFEAARVHVRFFALASPRAMVAAVTRTPFDRFGKQMVRDALEGRCSAETDAEVPADTRRIDLWVTPREAGTSPPDHLGLLGRITGGSVTLEFFHNTPNGEELHVCLIKHGEFRHFLSRRKRFRGFRSSG